jgi:uncharacterized protein YecE (DUF72 family)
MSAPLRIGCAGLPGGVARPQYFSRLDLLEADLTFFEPPSEAALKRWHHDAPADAAFAMLAWQVITHEAGSPGYARLSHPLAATAAREAGHFKINALTRDAWARSLAAARTLAAEVIVFQTPTLFAPSAANQDAMRRFFAEVVGDRPKELVLAWDPRGMWEPRPARRLADELGLVLAMDPLAAEAEPPEGELAYFRVHGLGSPRQRLGVESLEELAELSLAYERAWVVFTSAERYPDAQRFRKLVASDAFVEHEGEPSGPGDGDSSDGDSSDGDSSDDDDSDDSDG